MGEKSKYFQRPRRFWQSETHENSSSYFVNLEKKTQINLNLSGYRAEVGTDFKVDQDLMS